MIYAIENEFLKVGVEDKGAQLKSILYKNGESIELAASAVIAGGRTLVHARAVAEAFGADVAWDAGTGLVTINN